MVRAVIYTTELNALLTGDNNGRYPRPHEAGIGDGILNPLGPRP